MAGEEKRSRSLERSSEERGASPLIGIVLLFGLVIMGTMLVFIMGSAMFDAIETEVHAEQTEQNLRQFDADLSTAVFQNSTSGSVSLGEQLDSEIVENGELTVTISNGYVNEESDSIELDTVVTTDEGGNKFAYQAGGIWRLDGEQPRVVSDPDLRYSTEEINGQSVGRVEISPTTVEGNVGTGEHTVRRSETAVSESFGNELEYVNYVNIEVNNTSYHEGWYDFMNDEFDVTDSEDCSVSDQVDEDIICHDEANETVTVVASVDGETALENLVDIDPTVYGGLYISGTEEDKFSSSVTVNGYDDNDTTKNVSSDLFVANYDTYDLHNHADIEGVPVVNGTLGSRGNPAISPIGYGVTVDEGPEGEKFDEKEDAYWLDAHKQALATELAEPYDDIDPITGKIGEIQGQYIDGEPSAGGRVTAGLYDEVDTDLHTLDSSEGTVHIGVNDDLELSDVTVEGENRTSIYVDGDVTLSNVEITSNDRADALWIYATSDSKVTINDDFQGVVYAPGADIEIADDTTIDGAIVAGNDAGIGDDVEINFDRSLRTDTPFSDDDESLSAKYGDSRDPIDATFVLDRSGSMGPNDPDVWRDWVTKETIYGTDWESIPVSEPFRNENGRDIEVRNTSTGEVKRLGDRNFAHPEKWDEVRIASGECWGECSAELWVYERPGNDPKGKRIDATKDFIDLMSESNGDRAGVYDFNRNGNTLHQLDGDLNATKADIVGKAAGGTDMSAGFEQALNDYEVNGEPDQNRITVLLTDGKNSDSDYNDDMDDLVEDANDLNVTLYTVGLTGPNDTDIPEDNLEEWTEDTGGKFYKADNADDLEDLFATIAEDEIEVNEQTEVTISVENEQKVTSRYAVSVSEQKVNIEE